MTTPQGPEQTPGKGEEVSGEAARLLSLALLEAYNVPVSPSEIQKSMTPKEVAEKYDEATEIIKNRKVNR